MSDYLRDKEWSAGNGQCPECWGVPESWFGHPCHLDAESIGHKHGCSLASALKSRGDIALMQGDFKSDVEHEMCTVNGFLSTRIKIDPPLPNHQGQE